jgi:hypothetical protein
MNELSGVSAAAVLFGFLFAGFWWSLDRELTFKSEQRHFKPGYALLFLRIAFVGYFGLIVPLREASRLPAYGYLKSTYYGVTLGVLFYHNRRLARSGGAIIPGVVRCQPTDHSRAHARERAPLSSDIDMA